MTEVLILTTTEGHLSLAQAAQEALEKARISHQLTVLNEPILKVYRFFYRFAPFAFEPLFHFLNSSMGMQISQHFINFQNTDRLETIIAKAKPKVILTTSWGFQPVLHALQKKYQFVYITIVANPRTPFNSEFSQGAAANLVFDKTQLQAAQKQFPHYQYQAVGWFVRSAYEASYAKQKVKKELAIPEGNTVLLFQAGSEGTSAILNVLEKVTRQTHVSASIFVACGSNRRLVSAVSRIGQLANSQVTVVPLAYTPDLHRYLQAADLIVGKAGPNSIFEAAATLTPIVVTTHVAGQENGNLDLIRQYNIGWVEENSVKATELILSLLQQPQRLEEKKPSLIALREFNLQAKPKLSRLVVSLLTG